MIQRGVYSNASGSSMKVVTNVVGSKVYFIRYRCSGAARRILGGGHSSVKSFSAWAYQPHITGRAKRR